MRSCNHPCCDKRARSVSRYCLAHSHQIATHGHPDGHAARQPAMRSLAQVTVSAEPLRRVVARSGGVRSAVRPGLHPTDLSRYAQRILRAINRGWLTMQHADEIAVHALGVSPLTLWGNEWLRAEDRMWPPSTAGHVHQPGA